MTPQQLELVEEEAKNEYEHEQVLLATNLYVMWRTNRVR